uniref:F-BAR domain-containing protein n=1 Tax=Angiostrongylus cantonensis TaxID=6313 RepID=A0A158P7B3_ANGCA
MKHGEESVNEIGHFIKERLAMEEEYGKMFAKSINRVSLFVSNNSALESGWSLTKGTLELLSEIHVMMDLAKEVAKYKESLTRARKDAKQQDIIDAVNLMQTTTTCLQKSKETYFSRCAELEKLKKDPNINPKELSKVESKMLKSREEYRSYVEKYESVRLNFEEKMERACKMFQSHDRSHFAALQQFLIIYAVHQQEATIAAQQVSGQFRESLQMLNVDEMMARFVHEKGTGSERPQAAVFEEPTEIYAILDEDVHRLQIASMPSSSNGSEIISLNPTIPTADGLLSLEPLNACTENREAQPSPTASHSSDSTTGGLSTTTPHSFSSSVGGTGTSSRQKLALFLPKRKKTLSQSSANEEHEVAGGLFKFRQNRRSKKSMSDINTTGEKSDVISADDVHSTTSSTKSDDKRTNGSVNLLDLPLAPPPPASVDDEGYTIREKENDKEDTNWSSCSSSDEDENTLQRSKIRSLTIRPVDSTLPLNASVDELRDAIGHIKSEFGRSNVPLNFSASMGPATGIARARPRSNTPTYNSAFGVSSVLQKDSSGSVEWGSSFAVNSNDASMGESSFNISQSTANLMQATISEDRVPVAMAINEYSHVWFKSANVNERVTRTFGTVLISFPASSLPLLTDMHSDIEPLRFTLIDADMVKSILPNKQLLLPSSVRSQHDTNYCYQLDRLGLANWLLTQQKEKPAATFFNAEVVRYELCDDERVTQPPLLMTTYWKCEEDHTDVRIDYHLNTECSITAPLLNLTFTTKLSGNVNNVTSDPPAIWSAENSSLTWIVTELSRYGDCAGSLKARAHLASDGPSNAAHAHVQFQCSDTTISGVNVALMSSDTYHISMVRRKVMAGKYFCEPEIRK